ncbi:MAG: dihydroorotase, partial [Candidatus Altiarchaeales archaeon HGW-Altiarchaeales-2]
SNDIRFNVRPPLRDERERMKLVRNLNAIDVIASDHAPHSEKEKENGANGFSGIETMLPLMLNLVSKGVLTLQQLIEKICINPAKIFGMNNEIEVSKLANLTIIDLKKEWKIKGDNFYSKSKWTPFEGWNVKGKVSHVVVNGRLVMEDEVLNL